MQLILDDFGIQPFDQVGRSALMDIIEDRRGKRSTIITSQVPVNKWHDTIGEQTVADAILDRIIHQAIKIELAGDKFSVPNSLVKKVVDNSSASIAARASFD